MAEANDVLDLIDDASRRQTARDIDGLERITDLADRVVARHVTHAAADAERVLAQAGVDPPLSGNP